ncbi:uncharacterized protein [Nicotiana tomentosiformis]|uniref:uncharacterized protein n=1 Tax=Nicotiana tomentosiformis TaxID=4098 RepID=UPI00388CC2A1
MKSFIVKKDERLDAHGSSIKEHGTGLRNLEKQVGQIAMVFSERILGTLPADTERNPKEIINFVTLRSGQVLKDPAPVQKDSVPEKEVEEQIKYEVDKKKKAYAEFLKEILTKKRKKEETSVVKLTEHYSAILQNKLPQKKLENELGVIWSTQISLQLADQTTIIPEEIVDDVLFWVDKFVFPVDFIVVKMKANKEVPLILGKRLLAIGRAILGIHYRKLMLRVGEEMVTFKMNIGMG